MPTPASSGAFPPALQSVKEMCSFLPGRAGWISYHCSASEPQALTAELRAAVTTLHSFVSQTPLSLGCIIGLNSTGFWEKAAQDHEVYKSVIKKCCGLSITEMTNGLGGHS